MIKKNIIVTLAVMTALSSFSFAEQTAAAQLSGKSVQKTISVEDKKLYEQIYSKYEDKFHSYKNLERNDFVNLLRQCELLIGNSSAGILEAGTLKIPVVNVGKRQVGRMHGDNVIFCGTDEKEIKIAIRESFSEKRLKMVKNAINPYGDGTSSKKAIELIQTIDFKKLLYKKEDPLKRVVYE